MFHVANEIALPPGLLTLTANRSGLFTLEQLAQFHEKEVMNIIMMSNKQDEEMEDNSMLNLKE